MDLSNDLVMEILTRLPLLGKKRALSKSHAKASYHSYYKDLVARRQSRPILDAFIFQPLHGCAFSFASHPRPRPDNSPPFEYSLDFIPGHFLRILAVAPNGIILCQTQHPKNLDKFCYFVSKPSTKQWKGIPIPKTRFSTMNVAMFVLASNPLHFKIIRLSRDGVASRRPPPHFPVIVCELFDSKFWQWKRLSDIVVDCCSSSVQSHHVAVMACGSAHWKTKDETSIFAFHFHSETWSKIEIPDALIVEYKDMRKNNTVARWGTKLVEYEGKLGLVREFYGPTPSTELWVMDSYSNRTWTKTHDLLGSSAPMAFYASDISMTWSRETNKVVFSSLETNSCNSITLERRHYTKSMTVFPLLSDFEPWNFHPPPRTLNSRTMAKILRKRLQAVQHNVAILISFSFFVAVYNYCFSIFLVEILEYVLNS